MIDIKVGDYVYYTAYDNRYNLYRTYTGKVLLVEKEDKIYKIREMYNNYYYATSVHINNITGIVPTKLFFNYDDQQGRLCKE